MAYFSNGSEGGVFDAQCEQCRLSRLNCPIEFVQLEYNYEQCGNELARKIMNSLVNENGECEMFKILHNV